MTAKLTAKNSMATRGDHLHGQEMIILFRAINESMVATKGGHPSAKG